MSFAKFKETYGIQLNEQQEAALQAVDGAVLLLAVPGSGKTTVLVSRLGYMILECGIRPEEILTITYTVAAARDMKERFVSRFGAELGSRVEFRTINGLAQKILTYYGAITGRTAFPVIDKKEKAALLKEIFYKVNHTFAVEHDLKQIELAISYVKNMCLSKEQIKELETQVNSFPEIYEAYERELKQQKMIDFDDQMVYGMEILKRFPDILKHFQRSYRYICVDEAQDTSKIQHRMIDLLAAGSGNLFMVGDEDQSIYGFRAAFPEALVSFDRTHPGAKVLLMESNYRSSEEIVTSADRLISQNQNRHEKHMRAVRPKGGTVVRIPVKSRRAQYEILLKAAQECRSETAVLFRNNESALPLMDMLARRGIPYRMKSKEMTFFTHPVVTDISDLIRFAMTPDDGELFLKIYYKMGAGINKEVARYAAEQYGGKQSLLEAICQMEQAPLYMKQKCRSLIRLFERMKEQGPGKAVFYILHLMGYEDYMLDRKMDTGKAEILQLLANEEGSLEEFLPHLNALKEMTEAGTENPESPFILSTIHSSKGLEYDTVYLMDMMTGILPSASEPCEEDAEETALHEEERRLYYVAMTRAKNNLSIFTFGREETSEFSRAVFGDTDRKGVDADSGRSRRPERLFESKPIRKPTAYQIKAAGPKPSGAELEHLLKPYEKGTVVHHKRYGRGVILEKDGNTARIRFEKEPDVKKIALDVAVAGKILKKEEANGRE